MATTNRKIHGIIHLAALSCGAIGGGMAQAPGSDSTLITPIQGGMIIAIANECGVAVGKTAAADLLLTFTASMVGRSVSQVLIGWMPGIGNCVNALTAAGLTEAVGWAANEYFQKHDAAPV